MTCIDCAADCTSDPYYLDGRPDNPGPCCFACAARRNGAAR